MNKCNETNKANRQIIKKWTEVETQLAENMGSNPVIFLEHVITVHCKRRKNKMFLVFFIFLPCQAVTVGFFTKISLV